MSEETIVLHMRLPEGREWAWLADCNTLALSRDLDDAGRYRALAEFQATLTRQILDAAV